MKAVFILFDSLNRSARSCYGGRISTPNLVGHAKKGVRSDNHFGGSLPCMAAQHEAPSELYKRFDLTLPKTPSV